MIVTKKLVFNTNGDGDVTDITHQVAEIVTASTLNAGTATVFVAGSTAGVTTIEYEPGLVTDLKETWQRLVPEGVPYQHDSRWGDGNGFSHVRSALLGASLVVPFKDKTLLLGVWQQIVVLDFDNRPRSRQIIVQISGE